MNIEFDNNGSLKNNSGSQDINNNTKLYLIEDFDKVLGLNLLSKEEIKAMYAECGVTRGADLTEDYCQKKLDDWLLSHPMGETKDFY